MRTEDVQITVSASQCGYHPLMKTDDLQKLLQQSVWQDFVALMKTSEVINSRYYNMSCLHRSDINRCFLYWPLFYSVIVYTLVQALFLVVFELVLLRIVQWGENIELIFLGKDVFRLIYGCVCLTATEGTCSGVWCFSWSFPGSFI